MAWGEVVVSVPLPFDVPEGAGSEPDAAVVETLELAVPAESEPVDAVAPSEELVDC